MAETLQAPIVSALRGKEYLEYDNPYFVGLNGLIGMTSAYRAVQECDLLLMLGTDFPYSQFYPEGIRAVQIDLRGEQIGRRTKVDVGLIGDVRYTLQALNPLLKKHKSGHLETSIKHFKKVRKELDDRAVDEPGKTPIHPQYLTKCISDLAADDAVFLCDVGTPTTWSARYLRMNGRRRLLGSFNHGTMANAMPQAIGVQASNPARQVVTLSGDGGLSMLLGDLLTIRQLKLNVKIVVFNNGALGFVEQEMKAAGIETYGTAFRSQNFADIAVACGIRGWRVETPEQVRSALSEAFGDTRPSAHRCRSQSAGAFLAPNNYRGSSRRIQSVYVEGNAPWRRSPGLGYGKDESLALIRRSCVSEANAISSKYFQPKPSLRQGRVTPRL